MDVPTPDLLPPELLPAASMAAQKEVITWKFLTPSASKSKTRKLKAPNKLDTTLQEEILLRRRNLGISWEKQIYPKDYYSSITPRHKRVHFTSPVQLQSKFSLAAIVMEPPLGSSEFYREIPHLACYRKGEQPGHSQGCRAL